MDYCEATINFLTEEQKKEFKQDIAVWFSEIVLEQTKYELVHCNDPPWDHSGSLKSIGHFSIVDYNTLEEFLHEYNGDSTPIFVSGCGMGHNRYSDDLGEFVQEYVTDKFKLEHGLTDDAIDWTDEQFEEFDDILCYLNTMCYPWPCYELFCAGRREAEANIIQYRLEEEREAEQHKLMYALAKHTYAEYFDKLQLPKGTIEKRSVAWQTMRPILENMVPEHRKLIGMVIHASNSITDALKLGKLPKSKKE